MVWGNPTFLCFVPPLPGTSHEEQGGLPHKSGMSVSQWPLGEGKGSMLCKDQAKDLGLRTLRAEIIKVFQVTEGSFWGS